MTLRSALACGVFVATTVAAPGALASVGVGVNAGPITLVKPAQRGHSYALPSLYVVNTGSQTTTYRVKVLRVPPFSSARDVPREWLRVGHRYVTLAAGTATMVKLRLVVPRSAAAARYETDLLVKSVASGSGTQVGAGAAAALKFTVASPRKHRRSTPH